MASRKCFDCPPGVASNGWKWEFETECAKCHVKFGSHSRFHPHGAGGSMQVPCSGFIARLTIEGDDMQADMTTAWEFVILSETDVLVGPKVVMASSQDEAKTQAAWEVPEEHRSDLSKVRILVRKFS